MEDTGLSLGDDDRRGLAEKFSEVAKESFAQATNGMSELLTGRQIGDPKTPESDRAVSRSLPETLKSVSEKGLDGITYNGFEKGTHEAAKEQFVAQRSKGRDRGVNGPGRDFE